MEAVYYHGVRNFEIIQTPIPQITDDQVLIKNTLLSPVESAEQGTQSHLRRRISHKICLSSPDTSSSVLSLSIAGGFAGYVAVSPKKVFKIHKLSDEEATLVEPAACAVHGADKLALGVGKDVLILGAGPTGLILAQLLKLNGAAKVVIAANKGIKTRIARDLGAADEYIEIDRDDPEPAWKRLKEEYPYGFDAVVEATGSEKVANDAINYVRRGGTLMVYGVYENTHHGLLAPRPPSKIFGDEIRIIGSFAQTNCFPRAIQYLETGKVKVKGMITDKYAIKDYQKALDKLKSREALKVVVKPEL
ncbi:hypothetical protein VNI00_011551 [Paramarasmius palmivorus]|uniref:Alcohol dehydrogenase-like C-terminal domain-containing protein n=1 Tax=Paramarasmius palmivorus TaxID=297713 RepID=A0AAW0CCC1_9AGAR